MLQEELGMPLRRYLRSGILEMLKSRRVLRTELLAEILDGTLKGEEF
jgi:hypothetical protein